MQKRNKLFNINSTPYFDLARAQRLLNFKSKWKKI